MNNIKFRYFQYYITNRKILQLLEIIVQILLINLHLIGL